MVSSVGGKFAAPFIGAYAASKHGLEGMSASLRRELMLYGIDVIIIGGNLHCLSADPTLAPSASSIMRAHCICLGILNPATEQAL